MTRRTQTAAVGAALAAVAVVAVWTRFQYINLYGGREVSYLDWANAHYFGGMTAFYVSVSDALAAGHPYVTLHYPPGYPLFLAALKRLGVTDLNDVRRIQAVLDGCAVCAMYALARYLGLGRIWSIAAAAVYAVWPLWAAGSIWILAESASVPLVLLALLASVWAGLGGGWWRAAVAGVLLGASALVRPDLLLLIVPALGVFALGGASARTARIAAAALAFGVVVGAWGVHNVRTHGRWVFSSSTGGLNMWEGLGERPNAYGYVTDDSAANHVLKSRGLAWSSLEADSFFRAEYLRAWREHPGFVIHTIVEREPHVVFESEHLQPLFFGRARQLLDVVGIFLVALAIWIRRRDVVAWMVLAVPPLYAMATIGLLHYEPRYVRYVQLSYVLAFVLLAADAWRRLSTPPRGLIAAVTATAAWLLVAVYAARELLALHLAAIR